MLAEHATSVEALGVPFAREEVLGDRDDRGFYPTSHDWWALPVWAMFIP